MKFLSWCALGLFAVMASASAADAALTLVGLEKTVTLSAADIAAMPHTEVEAVDMHAKQACTFSGVRVSDLLAKVDAPVGAKMRGGAMQLAVVARAKDGYAVVYALAEFDEAFSGRTVVLADRENGQPLAGNVGPYRLVLPGDKKAARWARMVTSLEVVRVAEGKHPAHEKK